MAVPAPDNLPMGERRSAPAVRLDIFRKSGRDSGKAMRPPAAPVHGGSSFMKFLPEYFPACTACPEPAAPPAEISKGQRAQHGEVLSRVAHHVPEPVVRPQQFRNFRGVRSSVAWM